MLLLSSYVLNFKLINLYAYQNVSLATANSLYSQIQSYENVGTAMDSFLYAFDIPTVSQNWPAFSLDNSAFKVQLQNNFLSVADNVLNPIVNLNNLSISKFNFPFVV
jgi:hypothetical protein